jgi:AraC-like DNA-binding protein
MSRPFTRAQALQNAAFLRALRRTGNARLAARDLGLHRATLTRRRARDAAFAAEWDAALAVAHAALQRRAGAGAGTTPKPTQASAAEPAIIRRANGRLQLRHSPARRLTRAVEQAFLAALSATANVRLSAAAAGFSHSAFYARAHASPAFAREMRLALQLGYDRLECALLAGFDPASHADDAWRHNDPPPIPPMSASQALQLLYLHQKEARLLAEPPHIRRRRGESADAHSARLAALHRAAIARDRQAFLIAEADRRAAGHPPATGTDDLLLPDLAQVTGWSKADPAKVPHHAEVALFGGWRLKDWEGGD